MILQPANVARPPESELTVAFEQEKPTAGLVVTDSVTDAGVVTRFPNVSLRVTIGCVVKATPPVEPEGWVENVRLAVAACAIVNELLVSPARPALVAVSVYVPVLLTERLLNVAMPPDAVADAVPVRVAPFGVVRATATVALLVVIRLPTASSTRTVTAGVIVTPATALVGC